MKKIIAIGGGENGYMGSPYETAEIDSEIVRLSKTEKPKLLFIGTASNDHPGYYGCIKKMFGENLNCKTSVLNLFDKAPLPKEIEEKIMSSDIIYVGGGNTRTMLQEWKKLGVDKMLEAAYNKGIVMSGLSAGSICWFKYGISDADIMDGLSDKHILLESMGFIDAINCPHYDIGKDRKETLKDLTRNLEKPLVAIAVDNCAAIEIIDNKYRVVSSKESANAYRTYWKNNEYFEELIEKKQELSDLETLITHPAYISNLEEKDIR